MNNNVFILGLVSLLTDVSSEMIYPLIPLYLTTVMGASPAVLGLIEGIAESLASLLKVFAGRFSDRFGQRKPLAIFGYGLSAVSKILFIFATTWLGILWARIGDRFGKGIRIAPRDAIISESTITGSQGKSFGLHRAMDAAGAVIGILLAYWLFTHYQGDYILVFWLSLIPATLAVLVLFAVTETGRQAHATIKKTIFSWSTLDSRLRYYIIISFIFNLGNSSNQFLLIRAGSSGFTVEQVILLYLLMNVTYFLISYPAGRLSDIIGRRYLLVTGYLFYGIVYLGFALSQASAAFIVLFAIYGLYLGLTDGIEKAFLADMAPVEQKATIYGLHATVVGLALLPASLLAGLLWTTFGAAAPFWFGGFTGIISAIAIWFGLINRQSINSLT